MFGPRPRSYSFKLNKKLKALARRSALSYKARNNEIIVVEDFSFETPKTKAFKAISTALKVGEKKVLYVLPEMDTNVRLSARNLQNTDLILANLLNTYAVLASKNLVLTESSVAVVNELFKA